MVSELNGGNASSVSKSIDLSNELKIAIIDYIVCC